MINIMFWNTHNKKNVNHILCEAIVENDCGIVILAEYKDDLNKLCTKLSLINLDYKILPNIACDRICIIAKNQYKQENIMDSNYYTLRNIEYFGKMMLLVAVHLPSKTNAGSNEQKATARKMRSDIEDAEKVVGHCNTVIIGDFNANPFEGMCIDADCLHAIPIAKIAEKRTRTVLSNTYRMFYNPMWNLFGDNNSPEGTYYYNNSKIKNFYWNLFDQVIMRPNITGAFEKDSLKIIKHVGNVTLLTNSGIPNKEKVSDHLPIFLKLKEEKLV